LLQKRAVLIWTNPYGILYGGRGWLVAHVDELPEMRLWPENARRRLVRTGSGVADHAGPDRFRRPA